MLYDWSGTRIEFFVQGTTFLDMVVQDEVKNLYRVFLNDQDIGTLLTTDDTTRYNLLSGLRTGTRYKLTLYKESEPSWNSLGSKYVPPSPARTLCTSTQAPSPLPTTGAGNGWCFTGL